MVLAIIEGHKTQTRRVVKWPNLSSVREPVDDNYMRKFSRGDDGEWWPFQKRLRRDGCVDEIPIACPYGVPGDRLWVRETWRFPAGAPSTWVDYKADDSRGGFEWRSPIHMPRWASRLTLEVVGVRVEPLQEISRADAKAEGFMPSDGNGLERSRGRSFGNAQLAFSDTWDALNAKRGFGWTSNPWVWVVEFRKIDDAKGGA